MADEASGIATTGPMCFAVRAGADRRLGTEGLMATGDGLCPKIEFPGFVTRSGESFGVTATFHVVERAWNDGDRDRGDITRWVMVNGLLQSVETGGRAAELVR